MKILTDVTVLKYIFIIFYFLFMHPFSVLSIFINTNSQMSAMFYHVVTSVLAKLCFVLHDMEIYSKYPTVTDC